MKSLILLVVALIHLSCQVEVTLTYYYHPKSGREHMYTSYYDTERKTPRFTYNEYTCQQARDAWDTISPPRPSFTTDDRLRDDQQANDDDYLNSGYSRGHLVTACYFSYNLEAFNNTFYLINAAPQNQRANQLWYSKDEEIVLRWAAFDPKCHDLILIQTAVVGSIGTIGTDHVVNVPERYVNSVCDPNTGKSVCFWEYNNGDIDTVYATSVSDCESFTGLNFFNEHRDKYPICMKVKNELDEEFWGLNNNTTTFPLTIVPPKYRNQSP